MAVKNQENEKSPGRKKKNYWYGVFSTTNLLYLSLFFLEQEEGDRKGGKRKREKKKKKKKSFLDLGIYSRRSLLVSPLASAEALGEPTNQILTPFLIFIG